MIGAGAVGGALAAVLARGGHSVAVTARGEHLDAIRADGLRLDGRWGEYVARVDASETLTPGSDLVILATKATGALEALALNRTAIAGVPLLVIQNGLDGIRTAAEADTGASELIGGLATFAASHLTPGAVTITASGHLFIGAGAGRPTAAVRRIAKLLSEVIDTDVVSDFPGAQWTKLIVNQVNALPAVTGLSVQDTIADNRLRRVLTASMREAVRIALATGVRFASMQGLSHAVLSRFAKTPLWIGQSIPAAMAERMGHVPNPGSTLQSVRRGEVTEIESLNGAIVRAAAALGQEAPINALITGLVHRVEAGGGFVTVAAVLEAAEPLLT